MKMSLHKTVRENAERLNLLNRTMATDTFPSLPAELKDLMYEETRALSKLLQIQGKVLAYNGQQYTHDVERPYPVVIFASRYNGTYSGGPFVALNRDIDDEFEPEMVASDVACAHFWDNFQEPYGIGNSPDEAVEDLMNKLPKKEVE